jgi:pyruvate-formate lyase
VSRLSSCHMTATATIPFASGRWRDEIDVRDFVQRNYEPYIPFALADTPTPSPELTATVRENFAGVAPVDAVK